MENEIPKVQISSDAVWQWRKIWYGAGDVEG